MTDIRQYRQGLMQYRDQCSRVLQDLANERSILLTKMGKTTDATTRKKYETMLQNYNEEIVETEKIKMGFGELLEKYKTQAEYDGFLQNSSKGQQTTHTNKPRFGYQ